jgi:hypothetical protein
MAAPKNRTLGELLRHEADVLYDLAERADTPMSGIRPRAVLHDEIEAVAGNVRATVRGRGFR